MTEYFPLVKPYSDVIEAANNYNENDEDTKYELMKAIGLLGFVTALIMTGFYYSATYKQ